MKPGRKPSPPLDVVDVRVDDDAVARAGAAATELVMYQEQVAENVRQVAQRLRYDGPLHPDMLEDIARTALRRTVDDCLRIGVALVLIKEQCAHGEFLRRIERLGMGPRLSQRFMQAAIKFADTSPRMREAIGSQSKLFELLVLDDEDVRELDEGGSVRGLTLDRYAEMSITEMRHALREADERVKTKDRLIQDKDAKINALSERLHRRETSDAAQREKDQLDLLRGDTLGAETALLRALATVDQVLGEPATESAELAARQSVDYLVQKLVDACSSRGIAVDLEERVRPIWAGPAPAAETDRH